MEAVNASDRHGPDNVTDSTRSSTRSQQFVLACGVGSKGKAASKHDEPGTIDPEPQTGQANMVEAANASLRHGPDEVAASVRSRSRSRSRSCAADTRTQQSALASGSTGQALANHDETCTNYLETDTGQASMEADSASDRHGPGSVAASVRDMSRSRLRSRSGARSQQSELVSGSQGKAHAKVDVTDTSDLSDSDAHAKIRRVYHSRSWKCQHQDYHDRGQGSDKVPSASAWGSGDRHYHTVMHVQKGIGEVPQGSYNRGGRQPYNRWSTCKQVQEHIGQVPLASGSSCRQHYNRWSRRTNHLPYCLNDLRELMYDWRGFHHDPEDKDALSIASNRQRHTICRLNQSLSSDARLWDAFPPDPWNEAPVPDGCNKEACVTYLHNFRKRHLGELKWTYCDWKERWHPAPSRDNMHWLFSPQYNFAKDGQVPAFNDHDINVMLSKSQNGNTHFVRSASVFGLGDLFGEFGEAHTAKCLYCACLSFQTLVLKKQSEPRWLRHGWFDAGHWQHEVRDNWTWVDRW